MPSDVGTLSVINGSGSYTFSIAIDNANRFIIANGNTLRIFSEANLDYESNPTYAVAIQATNGVDSPIIQDFTVTVTNVLENTLNALTLSDASFAVDDAVGTVIGFIQNKTGGSTLSIVPSDAHVSLSGTSLLVGSTAASVGSFAITIRETIGDATNSPRDTSFTLTVTESVGTSTGEMVAWTPNMAAPRAWFTATVPSSIKDNTGANATSTALVGTWQDQSNNALHLTILGTSGAAGSTTNSPTYDIANTSLNSIKGVCFTGSGAGNQRLGTAANTITINGTNGGYFFMLGRFRGAVVGFPLSHSSSNFNNIFSTDTNRNFEAWSSTGDFGTYSDNDVAMLGAVRPISGSQIGNGRLNGAETIGPTATLNAPSSARLVVGNRYGGAGGTAMEIFEVVAFDDLPTRGNQQRLEGWVAHTYGITSLLPSDHPYKTAVPMVLDGTTTTANLDDINVVATQALQTWLGGYVEGQCDSYDGISSPTHPQPTDSGTNTWAFPLSLNTAAKALVKSGLFPGGGYGISFFYIPLGFGMRGLRNIDTGTGLAKNVGERFNGQLAALSAILDNGVKLAFSYHSVAPYWKQSQSFGNTVALPGIWAGGSYARTVSLESIRTSDPTQYAAQVDALSSAIVDDMEYFNTNVAPIGMFSLANEPFNVATAGYGHCTWQRHEYDDVTAAVVTKMDASANLPDDIIVHIDSWLGAATSSTFAVANPTRVSSVTIHRITALYTDADYIKPNILSWKTAATLGGVVKPLWNNEFEYFDYTLQSAEWRCANNMLVWINYFELGNAISHCFILHFVKQLGQEDASSNTEGYAFYRARLPLPYNQAPNTPGDPFPAIDHGDAQVIPTNYNSGQLVMANMKVGSKHLPMDRFASVPAGVNSTAIIDPDGNIHVYLVNRSEGPVVFKIGLGDTRTMIGKRYRVDALGTAVNTITNSILNVTVPAFSGEVWIESQTAIINLSSQSIDEDAASGSTVGALSVAGGSGSYTFSITTDTSNKFAISGSNLTIDHTLDYETATSHSVTVSADNGVGTPITRTFTIAVNNVAEITLNALTLSAAAFNEDDAAGTAIGSVQGKTSGSTIAVTPADSHVALSGTSLTVGSTPSSNGTFEIVIRETIADATNSPRDTTLTLTVNNVVDTPDTPTGISLTSMSVTADATQGTVIGSLSTTDPDVGDTFVYSFASPNGSASNKYQISGANLQVGNAALTVGNDSITIRTTDSANLTFDKNFTIIVAGAPEDAASILILPTMSA